MNAKEDAAANRVVGLISLDIALIGVMIVGTAGADIADAAAHVEAELRLDTDRAHAVEQSLSLGPVTRTVWTEGRIPEDVTALHGAKAPAAKVVICSTLIKNIVFVLPLRSLLQFI